MTGRHAGIKILLMQNMGDAHYLAAVHNTFYRIVISDRLQRCCYQVFAARMPASLFFFIDGFDETLNPDYFKYMMKKSRCGSGAALMNFSDVLSGKFITSEGR
jgi:hypothetical protein